MATPTSVPRSSARSRPIRVFASLAALCLWAAFAGPAVSREAGAGAPPPGTTPSSTAAGAAIEAERRPFVSVHGRALIAPDGAPLRLKGINLANWLVPEGYMFLFDEGAASPRGIQLVFEQLVGDLAARKFWQRFRENYITRDDIRFIKHAGFNVVRIPFSYRLFVGNGYRPRLEGVGYQLLDQVIAWCREEGLYVILDMHAAPGGQTGSVMDDSWGHAYLYEDAASQELAIRLWRALAERYRDEAIVIGYDLLNEPIGHHLDTAALNPKLEPLYKRMTAAIREVDREHLIIIEGTHWGSDFSVFGPPFDDKLVYSFHKYFVPPTRDTIQSYLAFRDTYDVPLFMGESGEADNDWIRALRSLLEANDIGWAFWPYKRLGGTASVLSVATTSEWEAIAQFAADPVATIPRVQSHRPPRAVVNKALNDFLENIRLENCRINTEYLHALGLVRVVADADADADGKAHD
jgi:Endoglucanase